MAGSTPGPPLKMTPDDVYAFVREHVRTTGEPVVTTSEVLEAFGVSRNTARDRLAELVDEGKLGEKKAGEASVYYLQG